MRERSSDGVMLVISARPLGMPRREAAEATPIRATDESATSELPADEAVPISRHPQPALLRARVLLDQGLPVHTLIGWVGRADEPTPSRVGQSGKYLRWNRPNREGVLELRLLRPGPAKLALYLPGEEEGRL